MSCKKVIGCWNDMEEIKHLLCAMECCQCPCPPPPPICSLLLPPRIEELPAVCPPQRPCCPPRPYCPPPPCCPPPCPIVPLCCGPTPICCKVPIITSPCCPSRVCHPPAPCTPPCCTPSPMPCYSGSTRMLREDFVQTIN
ncbi:sperm mitochondrial-associated cysteine-rich protein-like [Ceratina calcarata]|uniref:Sperm mitochondrial-associated cysteine-rich protein-like n=1 Tax=Ceratina calcarata TaxID=156304 RepID=A0AAJ7NF76_9HYME|nr:sperm mitochondrial-associated cysteine-rich protein-like [Ceratina calcarata]